MQGRRLLDPCSPPWASHFRQDGDELHATTPDGAYTAEAYDLNQPVTIALRRDRREAIGESLQVLVEVPALLDGLMTGIDLRSAREQRMLLDVAEQLHKALAAAQRTLIQLSAIPSDAGCECTCDANACELSDAVATTLLHIELEAGRHQRARCGFRVDACHPC